MSASTSPNPERFSVGGVRADKLTGTVHLVEKTAGRGRWKRSVRSVSEVAQILRVSKARLYELARRRMLPALTLAERQIRFSEDAL